MKERRKEEEKAERGKKFETKDSQRAMAVVVGDIRYHVCAPSWTAHA